MRRNRQVAERSVLIWFFREDVPGRSQLIALVRRALENEGLRPWPRTEAECFSSGENTLLIARPAYSRETAFLFGDLEALLAGALCCPDGRSSLYAADGGYVLTLCPESVCPGLYEFGVPVPFSEDHEVHAAEQGMRLLHENAIADLRRFFSPAKI